MRITREKLYKFAKTYVNQQLMMKRRPVCIYLTGSLLEEDPFLGGATDIDLIYVHDFEQPVKREIIQVTDAVHLDIAHLSQDVFHQPRQLRTDSWLGSYLCYNPRVLHDTQHWFEFTQASVCAQFDLPGNIIERARPMAETARQIWMTLSGSRSSTDTQNTLSYLQALELAANAIACLSGPPLTERRFLLHFPKRAQAIDRPGLAAGLIDLILASEDQLEKDLPEFVESWKAGLVAAGKTTNCPPHLQPPRLQYYSRAVEALWEQLPAAALWIILRTWTAAACLLGPASPVAQTCDETLRQFNLAGDQIETRLDTLDAYLDNVEEVLDQWAEKMGL